MVFLERFSLAVEISGHHPKSSPKNDYENDQYFQFMNCVTGNWKDFHAELFLVKACVCFDLG